MSMSKRLQIPIDKTDEALIKKAARSCGLTVAEWTRRILREKATSCPALLSKSPSEALNALFALDAPIDSVEVMIEQSLYGRLG